jgi:hypothetical protein
MAFERKTRAINEENAPSLMDGPVCPKIAVILISPFTENDYPKMDILELLEGGAEIDVIDLSAHISPGNDFKTHRGPIPTGITHHLISTDDELQGIKKILSNTDFIICAATSGHLGPNNLAIMRLVSQAAAPYMIIYRNATPMIDKAHFQLSIGQRLKLFNLRNSILNRAPLCLLGIKPADYVVHGGDASEISMRLVSDETIKIWSYAESYQHYKTEMAAAPNASVEKIAVFLDQNIGYHPDTLEHGFNVGVNPETVYPLLRRWFDLVEENTGLRVVIAAHPRANYDNLPGIFGDREIRHGGTAKLVQASSLVMTFYSTAANLGVLFDKPICVLYVSELKKIGRGGDSNALAEMIGKTVIDINQLDDLIWPEVMDLDSNARERFIERYIRSKKSADKNIAEIVLELCHFQKAESSTKPGQAGMRAQ